jgi:hypothetical protein
MPQSARPEIVFSIRKGNQAQADMIAAGNPVRPRQQTHFERGQRKHAPMIRVSQALL